MSLEIQFYFGLFLIGLLFGSFINVIIYRLPKNISIVTPRSHCIYCKQNLKWYENIPILSYILQRGKCNYCNGVISIRYILVEFVTGLLFVVLFEYSINYLHYIFLLISSLILLALIFIDYEHYILPDKLLIPLMSVAILYFYLYDASGLPGRFIGMGAVGVALAVLRAVASRVFKKESFGMGDIKLGAVIGFLLGWQPGLISIFFGFFIAAFILMFLIPIKKMSKHSYLPFGPFMIFGMLAYILWGAQIINWYLSLFVPR